jgi:hypothetical protein
MYQEMDLTTAREAIRKDQQQIEEMKLQEAKLVKDKDSEIAEVQQQLRNKEAELAKATERIQKRETKT